MFPNALFQKISIYQWAQFWRPNVNFMRHFFRIAEIPQSRGTQLLQGLLWFAEKTIEQTTKQWTLALKTIELRDTKVKWN